jgi:hypothetical protein
MVFFASALVFVAIAFCHFMWTASAEKVPCLGAKMTFARPTTIPQHLSVDQRFDTLFRNVWGCRNANFPSCKNIFAIHQRGPEPTLRIQLQIRGGDSFSSDLNDEDDAIGEGEEEDDEEEQSEQSIRGGNGHTNATFYEGESVDELWNTEGEELAPVDHEENDTEVVFLEDENELTEQTGDVDNYDRALADAEALLDRRDDENDSSAYVDRMDLADAYDDDLGLDTEDFDVHQGVVSAARSQNTTESTPASLETIDAMAFEVNDVENGESSTGTFVSDVVDDDTKSILLNELNYRKREIDRLKPEVATLVASKKLFRPPEGIPEHWYRTNSTTVNQLTEVRRILLRISKIVVPVIIVFFATKGPILQSSKKQRAKAAPLSAKVPRTPTVPVPDSIVDSAQASTVDELPSSSSQIPEYLPVTSAVETPEPPSTSHTHSVKPGTSKQAVVQSEKDLDVTWLDKLITKLENKIKALLQWEF